jgi:Cu+-exporting ATPase
MLGWALADGPRAGASAAVSVLLIAAPGALLLASPAVMLISARRGEKIGVLAASTDAILAASTIDTIVLDKDRTITTGELTVTAIEPVESANLRNLRWFAGALAHSSDHPVSRAIAKLAPRGRVSNFLAQPQIGISGSVDRHPVRIGTPRWIGIADVAVLGTQVAVEVDGRALGWITVSDIVRTEARRGVDQLGQLGLKPILVSDRPEADTAHLAERTGISTHHSTMTVDGCVALVQRLRAEGRVVAMAGTSEANGPALRAADLAISTAGESMGGGIVLSEVDVQGVGDVLGLLRGARAKIATNQRWAVVGMLAPIPLAAAGVIGPMLAPLFSLACIVGVGVNSARISHVEPQVTDPQT